MTSSSSSRPPARATAVAASVLVALAACPAPPVDPPPPPPPPASVTLQVLAFNDFHGQLLPSRFDNHDTGGAALLAGALSALFDPALASSVTVAAGDLIGASPLESSLFHDDPTVDAMNLMGLAFSAVGNHEFDEGVPELLRMQDGGCNAVDGCAFDPDFGGGAFAYLAANVVDRASGERVFPPYAIRAVPVENGDPIAVAYVGLATVATPFTTIGAQVAGLSFLDEADTVTALVPELHAQGADTIVVLIHEGGVQTGAGADDNGCSALSGRITSVVRRMPAAVKLVLSGHSHQRYNCVVQNSAGDDVALTSAGAKGQMVTDARLVFDTTTGAVTSVAAHNVLVDDTAFAADADVQALVEQAQQGSAPLADRVIGTITADLTRNRDDAGEAPLGEAIADAFLYATRAAPASAEVGIMNTGGERADLFFHRSGAEEADGQVTYGEAFRVQPFQNTLVTVSITGAALVSILDAAADFRGQGIDVAGLHYVIHAGAFRNTVGAADVQVGGVPLDVAAVYRVSTNSFLTDPVSGYAELAEGSDPVVTGLDLDAMVTYFGEAGPIAPPPLDRIDVE